MWEADFPTGFPVTSTNPFFPISSPYLPFILSLCSCPRASVHVDELYLDHRGAS